MMLMGGIRAAVGTALVLAYTMALPAFAADVPLPGKKLLLKDRPGKEKKRLVNALAKGGAITLGAGNASADDPVQHGGSLRVYTTAGDGFDDTYNLPAANWKYLGKQGANKGYKLKGATPIKTVVVKPGKQLKILGKGTGLGHSLAASPEPVSVVLTLGELRLCMTFGGAVTFKEQKKYLGKNAPAPGECPSTTLADPTTTTSTLGNASTTTTVVSTTTSTTVSIYSNFTEAPPEAIARLDEVLAAARDMLMAGATTEQVMAFLEAEPDVADVRLDDFTIMFTVAGVYTAIHDGAASRSIGGTVSPATVSSRGVPASLRGPFTSKTAGANMPVGQRMVGKGRTLDGPAKLEKKALVLDPYKFQFDRDDGDAASKVVAALSGVRDYAGRVTFMANQSALDRVSLSFYQTWHQYDVIYLSAHGSRGQIMLGYFGPSCAGVRAAVEAESEASPDLRRGLWCSLENIGSTANPRWTWELIAQPKFFATQYPHGLKRTLIYLDACSSLKIAGYAEALVGEDSVLIGWNAAADVDAAPAIVSRLFAEAAGRGFPAWRSFTRACAGDTCKDSTGTRLAITYDRADLRIREGLTVFEPVRTGACFSDPMLPMSATCPSCECPGCTPTFPMPVFFDIKVDGVEPEEMALRGDPDAFANEQLRLFGDVNDVFDDGNDGVPPYALPLTDDFMTDTGNGEWQSVMAPATLFIDDVCPSTFIKYHPKVMLPAYEIGSMSGGNDMRDFMYSLDGPFDLTFGEIPTQ